MSSFATKSSLLVLTLLAASVAVAQITTRQARTTGVPVAVGAPDAGSNGSSASFARLDHVHPAGYATTAESLLADGADCTAGTQCAIGVDQNGNAEGCWTPANPVSDCSIGEFVDYINGASVGCNPEDDPSVPSCTEDQIIRMGVTAWGCGAAVEAETDPTVPAAAICSDGDYMGVNGTAWDCETPPVLHDIAEAGSWNGGAGCSSTLDAPVWNQTTHEWNCQTLIALNYLTCSTGQVPRNNGSSTAWVCDTMGAASKKLSGDQSTTSTTYGNVSGFSWTAAASTAYAVDCYFSYKSAATTTGIGLALAGPESATFSYSVHIWEGSTFGLVSNQNEPAATPTTTDVDAADTYYFANIKGFVIVSGSSGTITVQMKSEVDSSAVTLQAGSWCRVE